MIQLSNEQKLNYIRSLAEEINSDDYIDKLESEILTQVSIDLEYLYKPRRMILSKRLRRRIKLFKLRALKLCGVQVMRKDYVDKEFSAYIHKLSEKSKN